jgi:hypothetical protein
MWPEQKRLNLQHAEQESIGSYIGMETVAAWKVAHAELCDVLRGRVQVKGHQTRINRSGRSPWFNRIDGGMFYVRCARRVAPEFF